MSDSTFGPDPVPESLQAYVTERLPGAEVVRVVDGDPFGGELGFGLRLRIGAQGSVSDALMLREPEGAVAHFATRLVGKLEALGMETFKVAIAERTARLEADLAREKLRAEKLEHLLDQANLTIRALVKETP